VEVVVVAGSVFKRCGCRDVVTGRPLGARCALLCENDHGSWFFSVELPCGGDGVRRRLRRGGYRSEDAAREELARPARPVRGSPCGLSVRVWLERWLASRLSLRAETRRSYRELVANYLVPCLGRMPVHEVRAVDVQAMFTAVIRAHEQAGRPLSGATLQRIYAVARASFNAAVRAGMIEVNPVRGVELPRARPARAVVWTDERVAVWRRDGARPVVAVWTAAQTSAFLRFARRDRWYAVLHLIALLGLRRGEACGLRWEDLDLDRATLHVARQVQRRGGHVVESVPKSAAGVRVLAVDHRTVTVLRQHRHRQDQDRLAAGQRWREGGWIFAYADGRPLAPDRLTRHFALLVRRSGLPPVRLHDLRHGAASLALAAGADLKVVSAMLGHASIQTTADTYTSVLPHSAHHAAENTAALLFRDRRYRGQARRGRTARAAR
jgi:integrase